MIRRRFRWFALALGLAPLAEASPYVFRQATFAAGDGAVPVASGDFNGDGRTDAVFVSWTAGRVSLLLGGANGAFTQGVSLEAGTNLADAIAADLDGDGKLDLAAVANGCPDNEPNCPNGAVAVFLGRGDGTFGARTDVPTGVAPVSVVAADFDGDGRVDLAVADEVSRLDSGANGFVSLHRGLGGGLFGEAQDYPAGAGVRQVLAVEVTGDGKKDLVVVNHPTLAGHEMTLLPGVGDGTFGKPITLDSVADPLFAQAADLDADGKTDLAVVTGQGYDTSGDEGQIVLLRGHGDGTFEPKRLPIAWGPYHVAVADLNGDGKPDLLATTITHGLPPLAGALSVLLNEGNGAFSAHRDFTTAASSWLVTLDANGDGHLDALVDVTEGSGTVVLGNGDGTFPHPLNVDAGQMPVALAATDLNRDGVPDLVVADATCDHTPCPGSTLATLLGRGGGSYAPAKEELAADNPVGLATGDFDRDGKPDVAEVSLGLAVVRIHLGNGDGTYRAGTDVPVGEGPRGVAAADVDGDGMLDLAATAGAQLFLAKGKGDGTFAEPVAFDVGSGASAIQAFDANGDGKLDFAVTNAATPASYRERGTVSVLLGKGDGTFETRLDAEVGSLSPRAVAAGDFDGDGKQDLAVVAALRELGRLVFLKGDGSGHFTMSESAPLTGNTAVALAASDFDGNGRPDVAVANLGSNTVALYLSQEDGTFFRTATLGGGVAPSAILPFDLDGDGLLDLAITEQGTGQVSLFLSRCPGGVCPISTGGADGGSDALDGGSELPDAGGGGPITAKEGCGCGALAGTPAVALLLVLRRRSRAR